MSCHFICMLMDILCFLARFFLLLFLKGEDGDSGPPGQAGYAGKMASQFIDNLEFTLSPYVEYHL